MGWVGLMKTMKFTEPLLTAAEEAALAKQIEVGIIAADAPFNTDATKQELFELIELGRAAWQRMWLANLRLANQIAHLEANRYGAPIEDVFQEACVGLAEAIMRYDHQRGARFGTFAHSWILHRANQAAVTRGGIDPLSANQIRTLRRNPGRVRVRTVPLTPELVADLASPAPEEQDLPWWFEELSELHQQVLALRCLASPRATLARTAQVMGLSIGQVRRLEANAMSAAREFAQQGAA